MFYEIQKSKSNASHNICVSVTTRCDHHVSDSGLAFIMNVSRFLRFELKQAGTMCVICLIHLRSGDKDIWRQSHFEKIN